MKIRFTYLFPALVLSLQTQLAWAIPLRLVTRERSTAPSASAPVHDTSVLLGNSSVSISTLPLGDSITFGIGSEDGNSYRRFLQTRLSEDTIDINFIGSVRSGSMVNNDNEGHPGAVIDQISIFADRVMGQQPQVVALLAGTNDVFLNRDIEAAPARVIHLVDKIFEGSPNTTVLVSSLTPLPLFHRQPAVDQFNLALRVLVDVKAVEGSKIVWVDMSTVTVADLADGVHPNAGGYVKMGEAFAGGIISAISQGFVR